MSRLRQRTKSERVRPLRQVRRSPGREPARVHHPLSHGQLVKYGIYLNEQPCGAIANRETVTIPLPYGQYKMHIVSGMNRKCNDPVFDLTPQDPHVCAKVHMKMGFIQNKFIIERVDPSTMPQE